MQPHISEWCIGIDIHVRRRRTGMNLHPRLLVALFLLLGLAACTRAQHIKATASNVCPLTKPIWVKPPEDSAVLSPPAYSYYFVNEDRSIWASASWATEKEAHLNVSGESIKVGWFRPAGAELVITGQRLDGDAPPLEVETSCCYPTRFQASGLYFPTAGCWKITARAAESELSLIVRISKK
jgi:hypothetical protein